MNISEAAHPTLHECDLAAKDAEIARLNKIVSDCLAAMPFGNIATHTPENLPVRIADLAGELARSECLADDVDAAHMAEIAKLKLENDGLRHARATLRCEIEEMKNNQDAYHESTSQQIAELVEALKKAKGLFSKPDAPMQKFPNWAQAILIIDAALKKVGAE